MFVDKIESHRGSHITTSRISMMEVTGGGSKMTYFMTLANLMEVCGPGSQYDYF